MNENQSKPSKNAEMIREIQRLRNDTPPEVIEYMDQRLRELRRKPNGTVGIDLMHQRSA